MTAPKKRKVVVRLTSRQKEDAKAILDAVREALRPKYVQLEVRMRPETPEERTESERRVAVEALEAKALTALAADLERRAAASPPPTAQSAPSPAAVAKARKSLWDHTKALATAGWKVTVLAGLEWLKKKAAASPM